MATGIVPQERRVPFRLGDHSMAFTERFKKDWQAWFDNRPSMCGPSREDTDGIRSILVHSAWVPPEHLSFQLYDGKQVFQHGHFPDVYFLFKLEHSTRDNPYGQVTAISMLPKRVDPRRTELTGAPAPQFRLPPDHLTAMERWNWWRRERDHVLTWLSSNRRRADGRGHRAEPEVLELLARIKDKIQAEEDGDVARVAEEVVALRKEVDDLKGEMRAVLIRLNNG